MGVELSEGSFSILRLLRFWLNFVGVGWCASGEVVELSLHHYLLDIPLLGQGVGWRFERWRDWEDSKPMAMRSSVMALTSSGSGCTKAYLMATVGTDDGTCLGSSRSFGRPTGTRPRTKFPRLGRVGRVSHTYRNGISI